jgi:hypothetical protein
MTLDWSARRRADPPASRRERNESCPAFQRWVCGRIQYMSPVGTAEPRRVKIVSKPHGNPRRRDRPGGTPTRGVAARRGGATNRGCTHADVRSPVIPSPRAACSVVPPGLLSYKAAPLPSDESLGYFQMPLRGTGPPPGHRSAAPASWLGRHGAWVGRYGAQIRTAGGPGRPLRRTGPLRRGFGDRCAEAIGDVKERRCNVKRIPVALKRCAIIICPSGAHAPLRSIGRPLRRIGSPRRGFGDWRA